MPSGSDAPDLLVIGHATRDMLPGGAWRLGGTVTFAAVTAQRLGARVAIVTSGSPDVLAALQHTAPDAQIIAVPSPEATTYENIYEGAARRQYLRGRASPLSLTHVPPALLSAPLVLLAPLAREIDPAVAALFPQALIAATPQGWLRQWDATGRVSPTPLGEADSVLPHLGALILSREDLVGVPTAPGAESGRTSAEVDAQLADWARIVPLVVVTEGPQGAALYHHGAPPEHFPAYPANEVDPTGAGDVFATSFLWRLRNEGDPRAAVDFANRVAALSIEQVGVAAIPTPAQVIARFGAL